MLMSIRKRQLLPLLKIRMLFKKLLSTKTIRTFWQTSAERPSNQKRKTYKIKHITTNRITKNTSHTRTVWKVTANQPSRIRRTMQWDKISITTAMLITMVRIKRNTTMEGKPNTIIATITQAKYHKVPPATTAVSTTHNTITTTTRIKILETLSLIIMSPQPKNNNTCNNNGATLSHTNRRKWTLESSRNTGTIRITTTKMMKETTKKESSPI